MTEQNNDIYIRDSNLFGAASPVRQCANFRWVWEPELKDRSITVFTDCHIQEVERSHSKVKIAWLIEPPIINSFIYAYVYENFRYFDAIATFDDRLLSIDPRFFYCPWGTSWIPESCHQVYPKSKMTSAIFSGKNWTEGHKMRHLIAQTYPDRIDVMGSGYRKIESKLEGLKEYRFQVVVENQRLDIYFTEKLMDCFMTGTVPIYWGSDKISNIFDPAGMLVFKDLYQLDDILRDVSEALYAKMSPSIINNFIKAKEYLSFDDSLWNCFKRYV